MKNLIKSAFALAMVAISFSSCEDVPMPYNFSYEEETTDTSTPSGDGTLATPYNVAAADSIITAGTYTSDKVYIKGIISQITSIDSTNYGNATYYISDNGKTTSQLLIYRGYYLNGAKFTSASQISVGDTVIVYGVLINYNGTHEVTQGSSIYSQNGNTGGSSGTTISGTPTGSGTVSDPYNVVAADSIVTAGAYTSDSVYVSGIVSQIAGIDSTNYGNATYYISDDGKTSGQFYVYRGYYLKGTRFTSASQLKVGDTVIVKGVLTNYNGTHEFTQGNLLYSINGKTEPDSSTGGGGTATAGTVGISGTTVTLTNTNATEGSTTTAIALDTLGYANAAEVSTVTLPDGSTLTFGAGTGTSAPKYYTLTKGVRMYANNTITFAGKSTIAKIVFTCDSYNGTDYVGNSTETITFSGSNATYTNTHSANTGGVQLRVQTITITYAN